MPTIQLRRKTKADWTSADPVLADGEIGYEKDTNSFKIGNGTSVWSQLRAFVDQSVGGGGGSQADTVDTLGLTGAMGRTLMKAADAATALAAIGAGTSNLAIGTTATTAKAGNYVPAWADITGKPTVIGAGTDAAAARSAIGAGTSSLAIGTTSTTAKAGNYAPSWSEITSKPAVIAAGADAATARAAIGTLDAGSPNVTGTFLTFAGTNARAALVTEVLGAIIDFGTNYSQSTLRDNTKRGAYFRIDTRDANRAELFSVTVQDADTTVAAERKILQLSEGGLLNITGQVRTSAAAPSAASDLTRKDYVDAFKPVEISQSAYDALSTKNATTLYVITS